MSKLILFIRAITGTTNINDGSTCKASIMFFDCHDYKMSKGGDGTPTHFHTYECPSCGKKFTI